MRRIKIPEPRRRAGELGAELGNLIPIERSWNFDVGERAASGGVENGKAQASVACRKARVFDFGVNGDAALENILYGKGFFSY